jgi:hypothetical protein
MANKLLTNVNRNYREQTDYRYINERQESVVLQDKEFVSGWTDEWVNGWMDGKIVRQEDGWMDV